MAEIDSVISTTSEATTPVNDNMDDTEDAPVETVYPDDFESTTSEPAIDLNRYATGYAYADETFARYSFPNVPAFSPNLSATAFTVSLTCARIMKPMT